MTFGMLILSWFVVGASLCGFLELVARHHDPRRVSAIFDSMSFPKQLVVRLCVCAIWPALVVLVVRSVMQQGDD